MSALSGMPVMSNNRYFVQGAIASFEDNRPAYLFSGNLIVYENDGQVHEGDLWAISRSSNTGAWTGPVLLTGSSSYQYNYQPAINAAGTKVLFDCTNAPYSEATSICEVGTDGTGFRVVLTPADSPAVLPDTGELHQPDYAPDGSSHFMLVTGADVLDIGLGCGN